MNLNAPTAAPRATPAAAAPTAPSATPAPVATIPTSNVMEHFSALAKADLLKGEPSPAAPAATPESPVATPPAAPAPADPAAIPDPNAPPAPAAPAVPEPAAPVQTTGLEDAEDPEPTAEEQATWTDGEKRLYGALKKERQARKEAKAESKQLKQEFEELKAKLEPNKTENTEQPTSNAEHRMAGALGDCHTFESVDARVTQAATTEAFAMRLQTTLSKQGAAPVVEALKQKGITQIGGVPVAELGDEGLSEFLTTVYEGARITQTQADPRKRFLVNQATAWQEAVKMVPELADAKSDRAKRFVQMANDNPAIRSMGPNWPVVLAYQVLGRETAAAKGATAPVAAPAIKPTPTPTPATTRQVPAAPRATPPTPPKKTDYEQAADKLANGTATLADITRMAKAAIVSKGG